MVDNSRLLDLRLKGYCCSQMIIKMGLEDSGREDNPDLIQAVRGLCDGLHAGLLCGILSSCACLIALLAPDDAPVITADLADWFRSEFETDNGGINCDDILADDPMNKSTKCPRILAATYEKMMEMLEESGYELQG